MRVVSRIGSISPPWVVWGLAALFCAWIAVDAGVLRASGGLNRATYDAMVRLRLAAPAVDPRIVIVDIDEASLARLAREFGRWPWPRDTLATVLTYLEQREPAAIVWDILFGDRDTLNPGGDAAFESAVRGARRSHFSVVRIDAEHDAKSRVTADVLPGLWVAAGARTAAVAMIPPALESVARSPLGYNNSYADRDGVVRRYRYAERLPDGGIVKSSALSAVAAVDPARAQALLRELDSPLHADDTLIAWRRSPDAYQRVPFWSLFEQAEGGKGERPVDWRGKIVIIGSTAPSLHDVHASPIAQSHPGIAILATAIDNALHGEEIGELPRPLLAAIGAALVLAIAAWAHFRSVASLEPLLLVLPAALLVLSYASLHGSPVFLELQMPAGLALAFLVALRLWSELRRQYWCAAPVERGSVVAVVPLTRRRAWSAAALDRLIDSVERHAPECRIVVADTSVRWPGKLRWPELAQFAAVIGPSEPLKQSYAALSQSLHQIASDVAAPALAQPGATREDVARLCLRLWSELRPQRG